MTVHVPAPQYAIGVPDIAKKKRIAVTTDIFRRYVFQQNRQQHKFVYPIVMRVGNIDTHEMPHECCKTARGINLEVIALNPPCVGKGFLKLVHRQFELMQLLAEAVYGLLRFVATFDFFSRPDHFLASEIRLLRFASHPPPRDLVLLRGSGGRVRLPYRFELALEPVHVANDASRRIRPNGGGKTDIAKADDYQ